MKACECQCREADSETRNIPQLPQALEDEIHRLRDENRRLIAAKLVTFTPPVIPESEVIDILRKSLEEAHEVIGRLRMSRNAERWRR